MTNNMGAADRIIRILIALAVGVLWYLDVIGGILAIILAVVAVVFLVTGLIGFCPGYVPLKFSTLRKPPAPPPPPPPAV